jgi:hypothetical protein
MGNLIGILSTVILVSTVCTLIFAVGAYVVSRKGRKGVGEGEAPNTPAEGGIDTPFPQSHAAPGPTLFKRVNPSMGSTQPLSEESSGDRDYQWK